MSSNLLEQDDEEHCEAEGRGDVIGGGLHVQTLPEPCGKCKKIFQDARILFGGATLGGLGL